MPIVTDILFPSCPLDRSWVYYYNIGSIWPIFFLTAAVSWRTCICTIMWLSFRPRSVCFLMFKWIWFFSIPFWFSLLIQFSEKQMQNSEVKLEENNHILHLIVSGCANADSSHSLPALPVLQAIERISVGNGKVKLTGFWKVLVAGCSESSF